MLCKACSRIPLDIFLPLCPEVTSKRKEEWWGNHMLYDGVDGLPQLYDSSFSGCQLCKIIVAALEEVEPFWEVAEFSGAGYTKHLSPPRDGPSPLAPGVQLGVLAEGKMIVTDGRRKAGLYWETEGLGHGQRRGT